MSVESAVGASAPATEAAAPQPVTIVENTPPSIEDTLAATWDKLESEDSGEKSTETSASGERARGPDGKFVSKDGQTEQTEVTDEVATDEDQAGKPEEQAVEPEVKTPAIDAPNSLPAELKAEWTAVPPKFQEYFGQREAAVHEAFSRAGRQLGEYENRVKAIEPVEQVVNANRQEFERRGIQPAQGIAALLAAQRMLDANPLGGIVQIARQYGYDLAPLFQAAGVPQQQAAPEQDPYVSQLEARLQEQEQRQTALAEQLQAREYAAYQSQVTEAQRSITNFSKDKPYFEQVRPLMATFLLPVAEGMEPAAKTLDEAYDMAVNASPTIRTQVQAEARAKEEAKRTAEAKAKAEQARKAAAVNVKSVHSKSNPKSIFDTIEAEANRLFA
jgi:hypothetical protein